MRNRVLALAAGEVFLLAGGLWLVWRQQPVATDAGPLLLVGYTLGVMVLVLLPRMYVEFRRHSFLLTTADVATLIGLFAVGPWFFMAAGMFAEIVAALKHRQTALKTAFNLVHMLGGLVAAAATFSIIGRTDPLDPVAWLAGVAAIAACVVWDLLSTAAVLAIAERQPYRSMLTRILPAAVVGLVFSAMLGIAALVLFHQTVFGPLLFAPALVIAFVSTRGVAQQRAERLHMERLYAASSNLTQLVGLADMLGMVATEARALVTGASALCCTVGPDGERIGVLIDDGGPRAAPDAMVAAVIDAVGTAAAGELAAAGVERNLRPHLPPFLSMVWAARDSGPDTKLILAVFRELPNDGQQGRRSDVLTAFVTHAAAVVANVGLHEDVQQALEHQVALNRQKGEFVAAVSHELRTPLASMMGAVQTVKRLAERLPPDERDRILDMGMSQGVRLQSLIEDLLLVAAADHQDIAVHCEPIALTELFGSLHRELDPLVGGRLRVELPATALAVLGDEDKLRRILINLIDNARKYAPDGPIEVSAERLGDDVGITVADHGPGVPAEDRDRVFERFVQLDQSSTRRQGGTGLGLSLGRQLAELLGGSLRLDAAPWGGARFELRLPAVAATAMPAPGQQPHRHGRVLPSPLRPNSAPTVADDLGSSDVAARDLRVRATVAAVGEGGSHER